MHLIDAVYVNPPVFELKHSSSFSGGTNNMRIDQRTEEQRSLEAVFRERIAQLDSELEKIRRKGVEADKLRMLQQGIDEDRMEKKKNKKKVPTKQKIKSQADGMTSKDNDEVDEAQAQTRLAQQMCMQADANFFGFAPNANNKEALRLYEESENLMNSKALLALGSIYEKGLINERSDRGGITNMGAVEIASGEPDFQKAFELYDQASDTEPYALFKLGQFMEKGLYEEGYRGKPNLAFAFAFYRKAAQHENGCREALYKQGEFYQKGLGVEKNIQFAIRKYDESQAEGYVLSMNALGTVFYNELQDYNQAAEWFKKASEKGCTRSLNNLGICYEKGRGVPKDLDQAFLLYKEAAEKGYIEGKLNLACLYFHNAKEIKS